MDPNEKGKHSIVTFVVKLKLTINSLEPFKSPNPEGCVPIAESKPKSISLTVFLVITLEKLNEENMLGEQSIHPGQY